MDSWNQFLFDSFVMSILGIDASLKSKENDTVEENTTCDGNQSPEFMYPIVLQSLILKSALKSTKFGVGVYTNIGCNVRILISFHRALGAPPWYHGTTGGHIWPYIYGLCIGTPLDHDQEATWSVGVDVISSIYKYKK